ncbi:MAG: glycosyltransferase family 39 protein, partial [Gemmatimonadales bacterium]
MKVFGPTETAARFPSLLFTIAAAAMLWLLARRMFDEDGAWTATLAFLATPFAVAYARVVIFDAAVVFWVLVAMYGFWRAMHTPKGWAWSLLAWAGIAGGLLTKGPVVLVFPFMVVLPWAVWCGEGRWKAVLDPVGILAAVAMILPWVWAMGGHVPGYMEYVLLVETAQRFATDDVGRSGPFWYFLPILPAAALPWSALVLGAPKQLRDLVRERDGRTMFLLIWIIVPLIFFTLAQSKRPQYILPLIPAITLLAARVWHADGETLAGTRVAANVLILIGAGLVGFRDRLVELFETTPEVATVIPSTALWLGVALLMGGSAVYALSDQREKVLLALAAPVAVIPFIAGPLMIAIADDRSAAGLATVMTPVLTEETDVVGVDAWPPGLGFYLGRQITVSTDRPEVLTSNWVTRNREAAQAWPESPLRSGLWWQRAILSCARPRIFVVSANDPLTRTELASALPFLAETGRYAVYGPCGGGGLAMAYH